MTGNEIFTLSGYGIQNITKTTVKHKKSSWERNYGKVSSQ